MKKLILIYLFLPFLNHAQTVVTLNLNQPPEFGFETRNRDTTIVKGESVVLADDLIVYGGSGKYSFLWSPGKSLSDSTIMNPIASPKDTTHYQLEVEDGFGCSFNVSYNVNVQATPTFVQTVNSQRYGLTVKLFPNPNNGEFNVQINGKPLDKIQLIVIDNSGRTVHKQTITNFTGEHTEALNMNLSKGAYNLLVLAETGRIQQQFIIQ